MYFQKDYILRMIEMMGELIRRILSIANDAEAHEELDEIAQKACGLPLSILRTGSPEMLEDTLEEAQRFLAAELLLIDIEVDSRTHTEDELLPLYTQALSLLSGLADVDYALPGSDRAACLVADHLGQLPTDTLLAAAGLFERMDQYPAAEDALYEVMERAPERRDGLLAFYARLDALDDRALLAGGFTRAEIAEGRAAMQ